MQLKGGRTLRPRIPVYAKDYLLPRSSWDARALMQLYLPTRWDDRLQRHGMSLSKDGLEVSAGEFGQCSLSCLC